MNVPTPRRNGFTLVELVITLMLFALMAVTLALFFRPAVASWLTLRDRTSLSAEADNAMRLMLRELRTAVPNSIRTPDSACFEFVPTKTGGRYRLGPDIVNAGSAPADPAAATSSFDVLTPLDTLPVVGDWVVVDNQNPGDVYSGVNRSAISAVTTPAAALGRHRLAISPMQFPLGYDGGRFGVIDQTQQAVFYVCSGASTTLDGNGNAPGVLVRLSGYGFNAAAPASCPSTTGGSVVATGLRSCRFLYNANQGATQQSGYIGLQLEFTRNGETTSLVAGAHVVNVP